MELPVITQSGAPSKSGVNVSEDLFSCPYNEALVHQVVTAYLAAARAGTKGQKTRSEVRGGGIKPFKQKGTGRARAGSIRSPIWRGGGKVFAATTRCYQQKVNRKMYRQALRAIFSELIRQNRFMVIDEFTVETPKTKDLVSKLKNLNLRKVLIITDTEDENLLLASGNVPGINISALNYVDPVSLIASDHVLLTIEMLKKLEEKLQ